MTLDYNPRSDTSRDAAIGNRPHRPRDRERALVALRTAGPNGMTDFQLADAMSMDGHGPCTQPSAGKRRHDLVQDGLVVRLYRVHPTSGQWVGVRRPSPTGASASVWVAVEHDPNPPF